MQVDGSIPRVPRNDGGIVFANDGSFAVAGRRYVGAVAAEGQDRGVLRGGVFADFLHGSIEQYVAIRDIRSLVGKLSQRRLVLVPLAKEDPVDETVHVSVDVAHREAKCEGDGRTGYDATAVTSVNEPRACDPFGQYEGPYYDARNYAEHNRAVEHESDVHQPPAQRGVCQRDGRCKHGGRGREVDREPQGVRRRQRLNVLSDVNRDEEYGRRYHQPGRSQSIGAARCRNR